MAQKREREREARNMSDVGALSEDEQTELLEYTGSRADNITKFRLSKIREKSSTNDEREATLDSLLPLESAEPCDSKPTFKNMSSDNRPSPERGESVKGNSSSAGTSTSNTAQSLQQRSARQSAGSSRFKGTSTGGGGGGGGKEHGPDGETDAISDLVGSYGRWQLLMTLLLSLFQVPNTFHIMSSVYQSAKKDAWCERPQNLQNLSVDTWRNLSHSHDNCHLVVPKWNEIFVLDEEGQKKVQQNANATPLVECTAWEYDTHDNVGNTWASEWNLVCGKEHLINVAETVFLVGVATGGIVSGYLSDRFGRKKMLFISALLQTILGLSLYFANSFEVYVTLRCLLGLVSVAVTYSALILAIEYVDGKWRTIAGMYNLFPLPISYMIISGIAYLTQDFRTLQLCIGIPGIFLLFLYFFVPESPRWLLEKGHVSEVVKIVEYVAKFNKRTLPPNYESLLKPPAQETRTQSCKRLFRSPYLRRITMCFICIWFTMNLVYYGIILNISTFGGNVYLTSAIAGLVEIPAIAIAIFIISKVGKKWLFCSTFICASLACCCAASIEGREELLWLKITFLMIGKFTISAGNTMMPVYTAELYPTAIRNAGVGACNVAAGIALILTPYLSELNKFESYLMMVILSCWSLFGGFIVIFLPEHLQKSTDIEKQ